MNTRKKVPDTVEADVMFKSNLLCCICGNKRGDQIHHIDNNPSNSKFENLAFVCFDHHDLASKKGGLSKKLSAKTIIKYRDHHYKVIDSDRKKQLHNSNVVITKLTTEDLLLASKNAIIILEIEKIRQEYYSSDWKQRNECLSKLYKFSNHSNHRVAIELFGFLNEVAGQTRHNMPTYIASNVHWLIDSFFPMYSSKDYLNDIGLECIAISSYLIYDSVIYLNNLKIAEYGLNILKLVNIMATKGKSKTLINKVLDTYDFLEGTIKNRESSDFKLGLELIELYRNDLKNSELQYPPLTISLQKEIALNESEDEDPKVKLLVSRMAELRNHAINVKKAKNKTSILLESNDKRDQLTWFKR